MQPRTPRAGIQQAAGPMRGTRRRSRRTTQRVRLRPHAGLWPGAAAPCSAFAAIRRHTSGDICSFAAHPAQLRPDARARHADRHRGDPEAPMKLRGQIAQALRMSIAGMAHSRFDRCHFSSPDSASLDSKTVCQLFTAAPRGHMGIEQQMCLQLYRTTRPAGHRAPRIGRGASSRSWPVRRTSAATAPVPDGPGLRGSPAPLNRPIPGLGRRSGPAGLAKFP